MKCCVCGLLNPPSDDESIRESGENGNTLPAPPTPPRPSTASSSLYVRFLFNIVGWRFSHHVNGAVVKRGYGNVCVCVCV